MSLQTRGYVLRRHFTKIYTGICLVEVLYLYIYSSSICSSSILYSTYPYIDPRDIIYFISTYLLCLHIYIPISLLYSTYTNSLGRYYRHLPPVISYHTYPSTYLPTLLQDQARPDQTRPDQTRPTSLSMGLLLLLGCACE